MDKTKRGGKQRTVTSKGSKTKVDVHKHFDPVLRSRSRKSFVIDDYPEVFLDFKAAGRSPQTGLKKSISPANDYKIEIDTAKRGVSLDRKSYKTPSTSSTSSYSLPKKSNTKGSQQKPISKETGPQALMKSSNTNNKYPNTQSKINEIKGKPKNINLKLPYTTPKPPNSPQKPSSPYTSQDFFVCSKDFDAERLKEEIITSAKICNCEVRQTVTELKEEIAKYRKTLHKNVNFLHNRSKLQDNCKECSVQTENSPQQRENKLSGDDSYKFQDLVTRIADLIGSENETSSRPPHKMASASTETDRPLRCYERYEKLQLTPMFVNQNIETDAILEKTNVATDTPTNFMDVATYHEFGKEYLELQKANIVKLDELIDRTKTSLNLMKQKFKNPQISQNQDQQKKISPISVLHVGNQSTLTTSSRVDSSSNTINDVFMSHENRIATESLTQEKLNVITPEVSLIKHIISSFEKSISPITPHIIPISSINTQNYTISNILADSISTMVSQAIQKTVLEVINNYNNKIMTGGDDVFLGNREKDPFKKSSEFKLNDIGDTENSKDNIHLKRYLRRQCRSQDVIEAFDKLNNIY